MGPPGPPMGPPGPFIGPVIWPLMGPHGPLMAIVDIGTLGPHMEFGVLLLGNMAEFGVLPSTLGLLNLGKKSRLGGPRGPLPLFCGRAGRYWMVLGALGLTCTLAPGYGPAAVQFGTGGLTMLLGTVMRGLGPPIMAMLLGEVPRGPPPLHTGEEMALWDCIMPGLEDTGGMPIMPPGP